MMKQKLSKVLFCILYSYVVHANANCIPKTTESVKKTTIQELTTVQTSSITPFNNHDECEMIFGPCSCVYTQECKCLCTTTEQATDKRRTTTGSNANIMVTFQGYPPTKSFETEFLLFYMFDGMPIFE